MPGQEWHEPEGVARWLQARQRLAPAAAIHHLTDDRKQSLFGEVFSLLDPGGVFCVLDVVASPTPELHERAQAALGFDPEDQHPSDQPAHLDEQLLWLRQAGFAQVDCFWKWFELAVLAGTKPATAHD